MQVGCIRIDQDGGRIVLNRHQGRRRRGRWPAGRALRTAAVVLGLLVAWQVGGSDALAVAPPAGSAAGAAATQPTRVVVRPRNAAVLPQVGARPRAAVLLAAVDPVLPAASPTPSDDTGPNRERAGRISTGDEPAQPGISWLGLVGLALLTLVSLALTAVASTTVWWMLHAWRTPEALARTRFAPAPAAPRRSFSLLVPARHEEEVLGATLNTLAAIDHPAVQIVAIVGDDDPGTAAVARAAAERHPGLITVVVDQQVPKNKPKALNTALPHCTGDVVGVFDAEDDVHPQLLRRVDARFTDSDADVVQGGVQLMNVGTNWWALRNCLEYYFWFRSRLHYHAQAKFIPLGGNTVFVRTELLREVGGWDPECLAEDCEIGVRLSAGGARVAVAYDPDVVTREETPGSVPALVKQRTRWDQGFLQVLRKGEWRRLPTRRQRALARYTLAMPFLQAATGLLVPVSLVVAVLAKVPTQFVLLSYLPLVPSLVSLAVEVAGLGEFGRSYGVRIRVRDYVRLLLGTFPYQLLLAFAAVRAVLRQARGDRSWEKTAHANAHRVPAAPTPRAQVVAATGAER